MNEAQMVLHAHPVNQAREARGELAVNSVWFWGAGEPGPIPRRRFDEVVADDPLVRALARRGGARVRDLAEDPETAGDPPGRRLVAPGPGCLRAVVGRDVESWRRELLDAEERWFRPLVDAVTTGRIRKVVVDAGLRTGESVLEAGGRRARRPDVPVPAGGLAEPPSSRSGALASATGHPTRREGWQIHFRYPLWPTSPRIPEGAADGPGRSGWDPFDAPSGYPAATPARGAVIPSAPVGGE